MPASNAIGSFEIGVSPIGTIPVFDWTATVISQYRNSPTIDQILACQNDWFDQTANVDQFYDLVQNLDTSEGFGLDIAGRIVGVSRVITLASGGKFLGFNEAGNASADPWNMSPFYTGSIVNTNFSLGDIPFRQLIYAKALANICDGSIPAMNQILLLLFPNRGKIYIIDNLNMSITIRSEFALSPVEIAILTTSGVFPRAGGIALSLVVNSILGDYAATESGTPGVTDAGQQIIVG